MRRLLLAGILGVPWGGARAESAGGMRPSLVATGPRSAARVAKDGGLFWRALDLLWNTGSQASGMPERLGGVPGMRREAYLGPCLAGLYYWVPGRPVEIFLDGGPVFDASPADGVELDVGLGVRLHF